MNCCLPIGISPRIRRAAVVGGALFALLGCTRVTSVDGAATKSGPPALRIGLADEPDAINPFYSHTSVADDIAALLFAPLFRYDARGDVEPELADRVPTLANGDIARDGRKITLHLRPNLHWSDGAALTARDIAFTAKAVMNPRNSVKLRAGWANIAQIETPDARTAILHLRTPDAAVLSLFAGGGDAAYPPLPAHVLEREASLDRVAFNAHPISSGAWLLNRWERGGGMRLTANPRYWRGTAQVKELAIRFFADRQALVTALAAHEIDLTTNIPVERVAEIERDPGMRVLPHAVAAYRHLDFNCRDPILADGRVRRAIVIGVDWSAVMQRAYGETGPLAQSDIFPTSWAAPNIAPYRFAPRTAAALLDAAGWKTADMMRVRAGKPLELTLLSGTGSPAGARAEIVIAAALQKIGITIHIKNMPSSYLFAASGPLYSGKYQLAWMSDTRAPDPDNAASWTSTAMPPNGANTVFFNDPEVDRLALAARATFDRAERKGLYQREWQRLHDEVPAHIVMWQREYFVHSARFTGFTPAAFYSSFGSSYMWRPVQ